MLRTLWLERRMAAARQVRLVRSPEMDGHVEMIRHSDRCSCVQ